eukprot:5675153-Lingulodinium_polyedra.AAC.1
MESPLAFGFDKGHGPCNCALARPELQCICTPNALLEWLRRGPGTSTTLPSKPKLPCIRFS